MRLLGTGGRQPRVIAIYNLGFVVFICFCENEFAFLTRITRIAVTAEPDNLVRLAWRELAEAVGNPPHPWRTPILVTGGGRADGRVVVLRRFQTQPPRLTCFTDVRSPKIQAVRSDSRVTWVFYHPELRLQLRVKGTAKLCHDDALAWADWEALPESGRREYASASPPGSREVGTKLLDLTEAARNFAVIITEVQEWDCLQLDAAGHRRVRFTARGLEPLVP